MNLVGSHYVLNALPIWATALVLLMVTIVAIFILRDRCEGFFYNTSYSAMIGDGALVVIVFMAAEILKRGVVPAPFLQNGYIHILAGVLGLVFGFVWAILDHPNQWADRYHHLVIAPLFVYLGFTILPVVFGDGTKVEVVATACLMGLWAALVVYDLKTERLDQRNYHCLGQHADMTKRSLQRRSW